MKRKIIALAMSSILVAILMSGCYRETSTCWMYSYENNSGYDVVIPQRTCTDELITVKDGEIFELKEIWQDDSYPLPFGDAEFVTVIFGGEKILTFRTTEDEVLDNIMFSQYYEHTGNKHKSRERHYYYYRYTFTPEMYERAVPIDDAEQPEIPE